jgi:hypothetical protein
MKHGSMVIWPATIFLLTRRAFDIWKESKESISRISAVLVTDMGWEIRNPCEDRPDGEFGKSGSV